jgi:hypothetical protein
MIKTKEYNNVGDEPKLGRQEVKVFKYLGIKEDPLNKGEIIMPSVAYVPDVDRVFDPTKDDYVDIANIASLGIGGKPVMSPIAFEKRNQGKLLLRGDKTGDREVFQYLMLSNFNASNPNRDKSVNPLFELVEPAKKANDARKERSLRREAMNVAAELSASEVREFIASMNKDEKRDISILRDELENLAEKDPKQFISLSKDKNKSIQANIKKAIDSKIIKFDKTTNTFMWVSTGETIVQVPRSSKTSYLQGFTNFVLSNKNGEVVYEEIVKLLK